MNENELISRLYRAEEELHSFLPRKSKTDEALFAIEDEIDSLSRRLDSLKRAKSAYAELEAMGLQDRERISDFIFSCGRTLLAKGEKDKALDYFQFAADYGGVKAKINYARMLVYGSIGLSSPSEGADILREVAASGIPEASYLLYLLHLDFPDVVGGLEAKEEYEKAANLGYRLASMPLPADFDTREYTDILLERFENDDLSVCFDLSNRPDIGKEEKRRFLEIAVEQNDPRAEEKYAFLLKQEGDIDEAILLLERAGEHGRPLDYLLAAKTLNPVPHFHEGGKGEAQEREFHLYEKAAEGDVPEALTKIGLAHLKGFMYEKDVEYGVKTLRKAIDLGESFEAPYLLGLAYEEGLDLPKDPVQAVALYQKSAEAGNVRAILPLARIFETGAPGIDADPSLSARYSFMSGLGRN